VSAADSLSEAKDALLRALRKGLPARQRRKLETILGKLEALQAEVRP
jgi:hypothetical protein